MYVISTFRNCTSIHSFSLVTLVMITCNLQAIVVSEDINTSLFSLEDIGRGIHHQ